MARKRFGAEQIVNKLREADVLLSQGQTVAQVRGFGRFPKPQVGSSNLPGRIAVFRWLRLCHSPIELAYAAALLLFGITDVIEAQALTSC